MQKIAHTFLYPYRYPKAPHLCSKLEINHPTKMSITNINQLQTNFPIPRRVTTYIHQISSPQLDTSPLYTSNSNKPAQRNPSAIPVFMAPAVHPIIHNYPYQHHHQTTLPRTHMSTASDMSNSPETFDNSRSLEIENTQLQRNTQEFEIKKRMTLRLAPAPPVHFPLPASP